MRIDSLFKQACQQLRISLVLLLVAALREWQPLAEAGNAEAQFNLGLFYALGRGVAPNDVQAFAWLTVALENGAKPTELPGLLEKNMSASSLAQARSLVEEVRQQCRIPEPGARR